MPGFQRVFQSRHHASCYRCFVFIHEGKTFLDLISHSLPCFEFQNDRPTFFLYQNKTKVDEVLGAHHLELEKLIMKHGGSLEEEAEE